MEDNSQAQRSRRRSRGVRSTLRKQQEIDHVVVEEPFNLKEPLEVATTADRRVGDGCYISATVNNRRYYGVLVDQAALQSASTLFFKDEASGLDLNRRMKALSHKSGEVEENRDTLDRKRSASVDLTSPALKRMKTEDNEAHISPKIGDNEASVPADRSQNRQVQKFRYIEPQPSSDNGSTLGYRLLLATYADVEAAAEGDREKATAIKEACRAGGDFVGNYYYQYEVKCLALEAGSSEGSEDPDGLRMSMGLHSFMQTTQLPPWFPLSNLPGGQQKVLNMLSMKKDNNGNVVWDDKDDVESSITNVRTNLLSMTPRSTFRVCVLGGGIAGLSCCTEIFRECERVNIPVEIVLLEGRDRFGGRLFTDKQTFKCGDGCTPFPVDLGASWIHGIELNPLATLAREAGVDFVTSSESVKMFQEGMQEVDRKEDERAGELFDKLLDLASDDCWKLDNKESDDGKQHAAVRWYASELTKIPTPLDQVIPLATEAKAHRKSSDISVDWAVGRAIAKHKLSDFAHLSDVERRMLLWNLKNVEYALGANLSDLSMRFWDIDERHAFEGEHVILRQGYSAVVAHMVEGLKRRGDRFKFRLNFPVGKVEYSRKTTTLPVGGGTKNRRLIELSDTCLVTSQDGSESLPGDFIVSCLPLGVLKESVRDGPNGGTVLFDPPLPFSKRDAIESVGFGLLNKVFLQFPIPFWRKPSILDEEQTLFGNASRTNPHHYMFFDIGKSLGTPLTGSPAILMSLVSGREAVKSERLTEEELVAEAMTTLRVLFSTIDVPDPIAYKTTRWGTDPFSRGSYTFLPPGTTDQDFQLLQSPVNGNGDSLLLEGFETMRLFFAGEHTTALHPSMAHGALLSGVRAAKEVISAMNSTFHDDDEVDKLIPMALYRHMNPKAQLFCNLCHHSGTTIREGTLLAFKKGSRQIVVHNCCAENSPEVEVFEGKWKNVFKAVSRSKSMECALCGQEGASIGCSHEHCFRCYHFSCGEDTGWRFDKHGKEYFCDLHRSPEHRDECVRISFDFYSTQRVGENAKYCRLCWNSGSNLKNGPLLAFQRGFEMAAIHERCARFTSIVDIGEDTNSRVDHDYRNIFEAIERAGTCESCRKGGATVSCSEQSCSQCFHVFCAEDSGWNLDKRPQFRCPQHRTKDIASTKRRGASPTAQEENTANSHLHHALFSQGMAESNTQVPGNLDIAHPGVSTSSRNKVHSEEATSSESEIEEILEKHSEQKRSQRVNMDSYILTVEDTNGGVTETHLARLYRNAIGDPWNVEFYVTRLDDDEAEDGTERKAILSVALAREDPFDEVRDGDIVFAINGMRIGSPGFDSLEKVLSRLGQEVDAMMEIRRS